MNFLALISVVVDAALVVAVSRKYGKRLASYALAMLCLASGCFFASTSKMVFERITCMFSFFIVNQPHVLRV